MERYSLVQDTVSLCGSSLVPVLTIRQASKCREVAAGNCKLGVEGWEDNRASRKVYFITGKPHGLISSPTMKCLCIDILIVFKSYEPDVEADGVGGQPSGLAGHLLAHGRLCVISSVLGHFRGRS